MFKLDIAQQYKFFKGVFWLDMALASLAVLCGEQSLALFLAILAICSCIAANQKLVMASLNRIEAKLGEASGK